MTDTGWPEQLEIDFDPPALHRERMAVLRSQRIAAWGWLALTVLGAAGILVPILRSDGGGLRVLAVAWIVLVLAMAAVTVRCFVVLARCGGWKDREQPKVALRLSRDGLWLAGLSLYEWDTIRGLRIRSTFGRRYVVVELKPGVLPDAPSIAGLNELVPPGRRRRRLPPRGPRVLAETLAIELPDLVTAVRHYASDSIVLT
jgi:hypothetical protein